MRLRRKRKHSVVDQPGPYDSEFPPVDLDSVGHDVNITGLALQRRITGPAAAELRVLAQIDGEWRVAIHENCHGNMSEAVVVSEIL